MLFSDTFNVSPEIIREYGAVDMSLICDIPLFIDPLLIFNSEKKEYKKLPLITCYAEQLNQVIFNLLGNAIDAVELKLIANAYHSHRPQISISTQIVDGDQLLITIKDNGVGITQENQSYLFEPFFTTKPAGQGIGLGLATSRGIIEELHRGSLTYRSRAGEGTEFFIQIPI